VLVNLNVAAHDGSCEGPDLVWFDFLTSEDPGPKKEDLGDGIRHCTLPLAGIDHAEDSC
jgi:hypothetical protein